MKCRFLKPNIKHEVLSLSTLRTLSKYYVNLRIYSEIGKIRTRKNAVFGHFLRSGILLNFKLQYQDYLFSLKSWRATKCFFHFIGNIGNCVIIDNGFAPAGVGNKFGTEMISSIWGHYSGVGLGSVWQGGWLNVLVFQVQLMQLPGLRVRAVMDYCWLLGCIYHLDDSTFFFCKQKLIIFLSNFSTSLVVTTSLTLAFINVKIGQTHFKFLQARTPQDF